VCVCVCVSTDHIRSVRSSDFWEGLKGNDRTKMNHVLRAAAVKPIKVFQELFVLAVGKIVNVWNV